MNRKTPQKHIDTASTRKIFDSSATDTNIAVIVLSERLSSLWHGTTHTRNDTTSPELTSLLTVRCQSRWQPCDPTSALHTTFRRATAIATIRATVTVAASRLPIFLLQILRSSNLIDRHNARRGSGTSGANLSSTNLYTIYESLYRKIASRR